MAATPHLTAVLKTAIFSGSLLRYLREPSAGESAVHLMSSALVARLTFRYGKKLKQATDPSTNCVSQTDSEHVGLHARVPNMTLNLEDKMRGTRQERIEITRTINRTQGKSSDSEPCPFFVKHGQSGISSTTRDYHLLETKVA